MRTTFLWSAAVALSAWEVLVEPLFAQVGLITCTSAGPPAIPRPSPRALAVNDLGELLAWLQPVLLEPAATRAIRSQPRAGAFPPGAGGFGGTTPPGRGASPVPVALGLAAALLSIVLDRIGDVLYPALPPAWQECLAEQVPASSFVVPRMILDWLISPRRHGAAGRVRGRGVRSALGRRAEHRVRGGDRGVGGGTPRGAGRHAVQRRRHASLRGRHVLVGLDRGAYEWEGSSSAEPPPCGVPDRLLRVALETGPTRVVPGRQAPWVHAR